MEITARVIGVARKQDEQPILPGRHPRPRVSADGTPRQEEGGRHDVEAPSLLAGYAQCTRNVGRLHEAKADANAREGFSKRLDTDAVSHFDVGRVLNNDGKHDIFLVQNLVVLQAMEQGSRSAVRITRKKDRGPRNAAWRPLLESRNKVLDRNFLSSCLRG